MPGLKFFNLFLAADIQLNGWGIIHETGDKMKSIKVAAIQMACTSDKTRNIEMAKTLVREAADQGAQIILLQELFETLYPCLYGFFPGSCFFPHLCRDFSGRDLYAGNGPGLWADFSGVDSHRTGTEPVREN